MNVLVPYFSTLNDSLNWSYRSEQENTCTFFVNVEGVYFLSNIAITKIKMMNEYFTQRQSNPPNTDTQCKKKRFPQ